MATTTTTKGKPPAAPIKPEAGWEREKAEIVRQAREKLSSVALHEIPIIYDFTAKVVKMFGSFIKSVVVFGSFAKGNISEESDIDLMILIDDASIGLTPEIIAFYNKELDKMLRQEGSRLKFHITTASISEFWDSVRRGDPLTIAILREGIPIADAGFFSPIKRLLQQGKIRPTPEAIELSVNRALFHLDDYSILTLNAINALYWAAIESAHAALMTVGSTPASPRHIIDEMRAKLIGKNLATEEDVKTFEGLYEEMKKIVHKQKFEESADELRYWKEKTAKFVETMKRVTDKYREPTLPMSQSPPPK